MLISLFLLVAQLPTARANTWSCGEHKYKVKLYKKDVAYNNQDEKQKLDIYIPEDCKPPFKTVMLIHGGCFTQGDKNDGDSWPQIKALVEQCYAVASINYRLADPKTHTNHFPAGLNDVKDAYCWLSQRQGELKDLLSAEDIRVAGYSAGGSLALALWGNLGPKHETKCGDGVVPPTAIALNPRLDFTQDTEEGKAPGAWDCGENLVGEQRKKPPYVQQAFFEADILSKLKIRPNKKGRLFLIHGDQDTLVGYEKNSKELCDPEKGRLREICDLITVKGANHQLRGPHEMERAYAELCKSLTRYAEATATPKQSKPTVQAPPGVR